MIENNHATNQKGHRYTNSDWLKIDPDPWTWFMSPFGSIFWRIFCNSSILICSGAGSLPLLRFILWSCDLEWCQITYSQMPLRNALFSNAIESCSIVNARKVDVSEWHFTVHMRSNKNQTLAISSASFSRIFESSSWLICLTSPVLVSIVVILTAPYYVIEYFLNKKKFVRIMVIRSPDGKTRTVGGSRQFRMVKNSQKHVIDPCLIGPVQVQINQLAFLVFYNHPVLGKKSNIPKWLTVRVHPGLH